MLSLAVPANSKAGAAGGATGEGGKPQCKVGNDALSNAARKLPTLQNHFFIVGEGDRADVIWSEGDFLALCEHMLNENPPNHFLAVWIDKCGKPQWAKAPPRSRADKRSRWAWHTITGKAKVQTSIGFYPTNDRKESRWGAIDFDAHNGEYDRARKWSVDAFRFLQRQPQQPYLILSASGQGYHLHVITREFYPVGKWIVLLKTVCDWIGAPITDGSCEIFPSERAEVRQFGKAIRVPGTLNPKTGQPSLIEIETVGPLLETLPRTWSLGVGKLPRALPRNNKEVSLHKSTDNYFFTYWTLSTKREVESILARYPIAQKGTRHSVLVQLVGHLSNKFGRKAAKRIVEEHYRRNQENIWSTLEEHLREFTAAWDGMRKKLLESLSREERQKFDELKIEHQREGFLIARAFAGFAEQKREKDFQISRASLADRLSMTPPGAGKVIRKLCELNIIARTRPYVIQKESAHYCWLLPRSEGKGPTADFDAVSAPLLSGTRNGSTDFQTETTSEQKKE
jgi:hypothetical protein